MEQGLPFTRQNKPWLTSDCIEAMNEAYMVCISKIEPGMREALKGWAADKVETGYCFEKHDLVMECMENYAKQRGLPQSILDEMKKESPSRGAARGGAI